MDLAMLISVSFFTIFFIIAEADHSRLDSRPSPAPISMAGGHGTSCRKLSCTPGPASSPIISPSTVLFNIDDFGAVGDGTTDDSQAFEKAWQAACSASSASASFIIPDEKKYLLKPVTFYGPCKSQITVMIRGTLVASPDRSHWNWNTDDYVKHWILFSDIGNLAVEGGGILNGRGQIWWKNSCKKNNQVPCINAPTALYFSRCKNLRVNDLTIRDSQQIHLWFDNCSNVQAQDLAISAPESSPNTDGIHISHSKDVLISDTVIATGDDCVSIVSGSQGVVCSNIVCGPGHGISIGSLGANSKTAKVSDVIVDRVTFKGTKNGVRIKTWQGGHGYAKHIIFQNIAMHNVKNPIIIDQYYCDSRRPCKVQPAAVSVNNVIYRNIKGTSATENAMKFNCSTSVPCRKIVLQDVNLVRENGDQANSFCNNLLWTQIGATIPAPCA